MDLVLEIPPPLSDELIREAERDQASPTQHAKVLLYLAHALREDCADRAFNRAVRGFFAAHALDADHVVAVFEELVKHLLESHCDPESIEEDREFTVAFLPPGSTVQKAGRSRRPLSRGKYAGIGVSSAEFADEKRSDLDREERDAP